MSGGAAAGAGVAAAGLDQAPAPRHHHGGAHTRHRERSPVAQAGGQAGALTRASSEHGLLLRECLSSKILASVKRILPFHTVLLMHVCQERGPHYS